MAGLQLAMPIYNQTVVAGIDVARTVNELKSLSYAKAVNELALQISKIYYLAQTSLEQKFLLDENILRMKELCAITEALMNKVW
ncbi:MAG: TolC family protein [Bacteroides sp.]|nr:TolC family protein [Bacteroides sp.]